MKLAQLRFLLIIILFHSIFSKTISSYQKIKKGSYNQKKSQKNQLFLSLEEIEEEKEKEMEEEIEKETEKEEEKEDETPIFNLPPSFNIGDKVIFDFSNINCFVLNFTTHEFAVVES